MRSARRGFSLIELVAVMALLGLCTLMALPKVLQATATAKLRAGREATASYLTAARRLAMARSVATRFEIVNSTTVRVIADDGSNAVLMPALNVQQQYAVTVSGRLSPSGTSTDFVRFDKRGLARTGVNETRVVQLVNTAGTRDSVCVSGAGMIMRGTCR